MNYIHNIWILLSNWLLDRILPHSCALCGAPNEVLCKKCQELIIIPHAQCVVCRARNKYGSVCPGRCRSLLPQGPTRVIWTSNYTTTKSIIGSFKYKKRAELAHPLGQILAQKLQIVHPRLDPSEAIIIPIPMHPKKERARGFNQAELLAEALEKETGIPLVRGILKRHEYRRPQVFQRSKHNRIENMRESLSVSLDTPSLSGKTVILVDDVVTTGATMTAASQALRAKNPKRIVGVAVAH